MNIHLSPVSMIGGYALTVAGGAITLNGQRHALVDLFRAMPVLDEFGGVAVPGSLPEFVVAATEDSVTLLLPYWGEPSQAVAFPEPIIDPPDGPVQLPE